MVASAEPYETEDERKQICEGQLVGLQVVQLQPRKAGLYLGNNTVYWALILLRFKAPWFPGLINSRRAMS